MKYGFYVCFLTILLCAGLWPVALSLCLIVEYCVAKKELKLIESRGFHHLVDDHQSA